MTKIKSISIENLIHKARAALEAGNKIIAREYALAAVEKSPNSEQAWLILAAVSDPEQSLRYLENALRANPESQAARKGVRLIASQIAIQEKSEVIEKSSERLDDTSRIPIPIPEEATRDKNSDKHKPDAKDKEEGEKSEIKAETDRKTFKKTKLTKKLKPTTNNQEIKIEPKTELKHYPDKLSKKEIFRKNLQKKTPAPVEVSISTENIFKAISEGKAEKAARASTTPKDISPPAAAAPIKTKKSARGQDSAIKPKSSSITKTQNATDSPKTRPDKKPVKQPVKKKRAAKADRKQPRQKKSVLTKKIKKPGDKTNVDVDIIELVLISLAAILLPLMAFLYFYLTK